MSELRFKEGDRVVISYSRSGMFVGRTATVKHVGPWKEGGRHPSGLKVLADNDYIIVLDDPAGVSYPELHLDEGLAVRDNNLELLTKSLGA